MSRMNQDCFPYSSLNDYEIYQDRGLLPSPNPLCKLPPYYQCWDKLGKKLPKLLIAGPDHVRSKLSEMPTLDSQFLENTAQYERAMVLLTHFAQAYVWCDADGSGNCPSIIDKLPASIAIPFYKVAQELGRPPVLQHATVCQNWRLIDQSKPIELGNLVMKQCFFGGIDEEWFFLVAIAVEAKGGLIIDSIVQAQKAVDIGAVEKVTSHIGALFTYLKEITTIVKRMREWCLPAVFYMRLRPFLHGWGNLPNGLTFEGVDEIAGIPQKFAGGSAGQSCLIQIIDAALEIKHAEGFLKYMRPYMQPLHYKFLLEVEAKSTIRQFVVKHNNSLQLVENFNSCVNELVEFRNYHIQLATSYILSQAQSKTHADRGTGGSSFMKFLQQIRQDTLTSIVNVA